MAQAPKDIAARTQGIIDAWEELAPTATFGRMTLQQFKDVTKPSFDARGQIVKLDEDTKAALVTRDQADTVTETACNDVIKGIVADKNFGDDCALYEKCGYIRKSQRGTGLTRKNAAATKAQAKP